MEPEREQLAGEMEARRRELRVNWTEVARRAGMSPQNLLRIRNGEISVTDDAADGIDEALYWEQGSVAAVLAGRGPTPLDIPVRTRRRRRTPLDPLTSSPEDIIAFLDEVRRYQGEEVYQELLAGTLEVQRLDAERKRKAVTSKEHEEL